MPSLPLPVPYRVPSNVSSSHERRTKTPSTVVRSGDEVCFFKRKLASPAGQVKRPYHDCKCTNVSILGSSRIDRFCLESILPYFAWVPSEGNKSPLQGDLSACDGDAVSNRPELRLIVYEIEGRCGYIELYHCFQW